MIKKSKTDRVLGIYIKLCNGYVVNKYKEALECGVDERTIQRDIDDLRCFISDDLVESNNGYCEIEYDRERCGYVMRKACYRSWSNKLKF